MQIRQYNRCYSNIIAIKDIIAAAKKCGKNRGLLAIENANKIVIAKVAKILSVINFDNKYNWAINNANIDIAEDLKLTGIKKY